ncbi:MAG: hypothetical protein ACRDNX_08560, partial [Gaiellaceae bacterium]
MGGREPLFSEEEVERGRRYHRPLYVAYAFDLALSLGTLAALSFGPAGDALHGAVERLPWSLETVAFAGLVTLVVTAVRLPLLY